MGSADERNQSKVVLLYFETDMETLLKSPWSTIHRLDGPVVMTMRLTVNPYCFGANYSMNLIRGVCSGGNDDWSYASLPDEFVRKIHFAVLRHLSRPDWKAARQKWIIPRKEKNRRLLRPSRAGREIFRDVFRKLSIYFRHVRKTRCSFARRRTTYRAWVIYRFRQCITIRQYISNT